MISTEFLRLSWLPPSQVLDEIVQKVQTMETRAVASDSFKQLDGPDTVRALLHNLQVLLAVQDATQVHTKSAVQQQLNSFVADLYGVFRTILEQIVDNKSNGETHGSEIGNPSATIHLVVLNAEQVIAVQQDGLQSASAMRVLNIDSLALLHTILSTARGLYADVSSTSASVLKSNRHEQMVQLRVTPAVAPAHSLVPEITTSAPPNTLQLTDLPSNTVVAPVYKKNFNSPAVANRGGHSAASLMLIVDNAEASLMRIVDTLAGNRVSSSTSGGSSSKKVSIIAPVPASAPSVEAAVREDRATLLTQTIIHIARHWNQIASCVESDRVTAHSMILLLSTQSHTALQSAGFTAIVPIAMRLLDGYLSSNHTLGLLLLYRAADTTPSGLLATFLEWILPHIFSYLEIVSDDWSRLLASRLLHSLLASGIHSPIALQHSHLYIESSIRQLQMKPTVEFAWPYLVHFHAIFSWYPEGTLRFQLTALVDVYLQLLNVWHLPLQSAALKGISALTQRLQSGMELYVHKIATELCRLHIFYHSQQRDISGASTECITIMVANITTLGSLLRKLNVTAWDAYLSEVLAHMQRSVVAAEETFGGNKQTSNSAEATAHALLVIANYQQNVQNLAV